MRRSFQLAAIGYFALLAAAPAQAAISEAEQVTIWRYQLHRSYCAGNWSEAISLAGAMMGSKTVREHERIWLFLLRQDMFNFQSEVAEFPGCQGGRLLAGVTAEATVASLETDRELEQSSIDWNRGLAAIGANSTSASRLTSPASTASFPVSTVGSPPNPTPSNSDCTAYEGERWVADGSTSNQWNYEIWQDSGRQFYVRYWRQDETCAQARTTAHHLTQTQAWQAFRCDVGLETRLEDYTCNASNQRG